MAKSKPKAIDMFCGCGGTTQGLKDAGFDVIAGVEVDPLAVKTFRTNHDEVTVWDRTSPVESAPSITLRLWTGSCADRYATLSVIYPGRLQAMIRFMIRWRIAAKESQR